MEYFWKRRLFFFACAAGTMALGLATRFFSNELPSLIAEYGGDTAWALMVFFLISMLRPNATRFKRSLLAILFAYTIEFSQLYHAPWIDEIRNTKLGGLILGFGFLWTDLVCYAIGIAMGSLLDYLIVSRFNGQTKELR